MKTRKTIEILEKQNYNCAGLSCFHCPADPGEDTLCKQDPVKIKKRCDEWLAAHPKKSKWRKPEDYTYFDGEIIVEFSCREHQIMRHLKKKTMEDFSDISGDLVIVAWRHLPKPYKGDV